MKILIATQNQHKKLEMEAILRNASVTLLTLKDLNDFDEVTEDGDTFEKNASIKASYFGNKHQMYTISDDSGLMVDALNGAPGVHSKRYSSTGLDEDNNQKLLNSLKYTTNKNATFVTNICFYDPFLKEEKHFTGRVEGIILEKPRGTNGFGYDPLFYIENYQLTYAEMSNDLKNKVSHRSIALSKFKEALHEIINHI